MGDQGFGISPDMIKFVAGEIRSVVELGVQVGIIVGGGNIFRGIAASSLWHGPHLGRPHGHAGDGHQQSGPAGCTGKAGCSNPGADSHIDA